MKTFHTDIAVQRSSFENDEGCSENIQEQKYEPSKTAAYIRKLTEIVFTNLYEIESGQHQTDTTLHMMEHKYKILQRRV